MTPLIADRFVAAGRSWIDIATGAPVALRVEPASTHREQFAWSLHCETLANLRHDLVNPLVDFGALDRDRRFEAYEQRGPLRAGGRAAARLLEHGVRFLRAHDIRLARGGAALALRPVVAGPSVRSRPVGLLLQRRAAYEALIEALDVAQPVGVARVLVSAPWHSGLRTLRVLVARSARLQGYVPVAATVAARLPGILDHLAGRHVCVLADAHDVTSAVALLARLGAASARRHLVLEFARRSDAGPVVHIDRMGVAAMTAMVHIDREFGPAPEELLTAARQAEGRPGLLVARLSGLFPPAVQATAMVARETAPAYGMAAPTAGPRRRVRDVLARAGARAERLSRSGRHAAATRLLSRAVRVLAARGARDEAADCALRLGRHLLERGATVAAARAFDAAREHATSDAARIAATVGTGATRLLDARPSEAEAAFRTAMAAARAAHHPDLHAIAATKLADCLCRASRYDEAEVVLDEAPNVPAGMPERDAVRVRVHLARGRIPAATQCAQRALADARQTRDAHALSTAHEAIARGYAAAGDVPAARDALVAAIHVARDSHLSVTVLRLHIVYRDLLHEWHGAIPHVRLLPPLLRVELDAATARAQPFVEGDERPTDLETLIGIAQGADDDRQAVDRVCEAVARQTGARSVLVLGSPPEMRQLALAGKPWRGEPAAALRVLSGESRVRADIRAEPCEAAEPVRYVGELVAAIACHFAAGTPVNPDRTSALLRAAALAVAPGVRGLLDRAVSRPADAAAGDLLGESVVARALRDAIARAARAPFPVLIEGESGSGKELVARAIHRLGTRRERRFCAVNCAALSDDLLEVELFGHARGAFTGAVGERAGLFEDADGGTLFLDEVGELSPRAQAKLLRVLQDGEVRRVGENVARRVDVRVVAATNRRLEAEVSAGRFRADLRFRLDVVRLDVPPLRERSDDVPLLAARFWTEVTGRVGSHATLSPEALAALARYDWPGNVRELQNVLAWMAVQSPRRGRVGPSALPAHVAGAVLPAATTFDAAREAFERRFVRAALASANGQRGRAADALGVTRQGLAKMLRRLHIEAP